VTILFLSKTLA